MTTLVQGNDINRIFSNGEGFSDGSAVWLECHTKDGQIFRTINTLVLGENGLTYEGAELMANTVEESAKATGIKDNGWYHYRNVYGSKAWTQADEIGLMDDEEQRNLGL